MNLIVAVIIMNLELFSKFLSEQKITEFKELINSFIIGVVPANKLFLEKNALYFHF